MRLSSLVLVLLVVVAVPIAFGHVINALSWSGSRAVPKAFKEVLSISNENGLMTFVSVQVEFLLGLACFAVRRRLRLRDEPGARGWFWVGTFFVYMSLDDATMLHERVGWLFDPFFKGVDTFSWVIVYGPLFVVAGAASAWHFWRSYAGDAVARRMVLAAFGLFGLALVIEVAEGPLHAADVELRGFSIVRYTMLVEELFELVAPALLLAAACRYLERRPPTLQAVVGDLEEDQPTVAAPAVDRPA